MGQLFRLVISVLCLSLPLFWLALLLQFCFAVDLHLLPPSGYKNGLDQYVLLPAITLAIPTAGYLARITNASLTTFLGSDFIRTAHGKGLKKSTVIWQHVLPNAVIPIASAAGHGPFAVVCRHFDRGSHFSWPGIGQICL